MKTKTNKLFTPSGWANRINLILDKTFTDDIERFQLNLGTVIKDLSKELYPDEPISLVKGADFSDFDGCLIQKEGRSDWGIFYNKDLSSPGRIRFTLAHEFGHYLLHRKKCPQRLNCKEIDTIPWLNNYFRRIEREANEFAACLLIPKNHFERRIRPFDTPSLDLLSECAEQYRVSLTATILHWINCTKLRSVVVASRDEFILWSRSSKAAMQSSNYFKTANESPIPLHEDTLPRRERNLLESRSRSVIHPPGIWFEEDPCEEIALVSDQYDFVVSILFLESDQEGYNIEEDPVIDAYDELMDKFGL